MEIKQGSVVVSYVSLSAENTIRQNMTKTAIFCTSGEWIINIQNAVVVKVVEIMIM